MMLAERGLLPEELALNLAKMAGFRNLLVHGYASVDDTAMLGFMRHNLRDVEDFLDHVLRLAGEQD